MVKGEFKMDEQKNTEEETKEEQIKLEPNQTKKEDGIFDQFKRGVDIKID